MLPGRACCVKIQEDLDAREQNSAKKYVFYSFHIRSGYLPVQRYLQLPRNVLRTVLKILNGTVKKH